MTYLKEIIKAIKNGKKLPSWVELVRQKKAWDRYNRDKDVIKNAIPWITLQAIGYLESYLTKEMCVFEYGGGGSTLFFNKKVRELVTVEHDKKWFTILEQAMQSNLQVKWTPHFVEPLIDSANSGKDFSNPDDYISSGDEFRGFEFKKYVSVIDSYPDKYFDVVLVDGRARPSCLKHSVNKVKVGGILILDNADRAYYLNQTNRLLSKYKLLINQFGPTPYVTFFCQTNIWERSGNEADMNHKIV